MAKETALVTKVKLCDVVKTDASVDMNSIVAFFISKYENKLLASKKELSERIAKLNMYLNNDFVKEVKEDIKFDSYDGVKIKLLGVTIKATLSSDFSALQENKVVTINISNSNETTRRSDTGGYINISRALKVSDELHAKYVAVVDEIKTLRGSLQVVLDQINNVSRKEREIRGTLAEKTLTESGVGYLFEDETLLNLVNIPQLAMKTVS